MSFMDPSGRVAKAFIIFGIWIILFWAIPQRGLFSLLYSIVFIVLLANIIFQIYNVEKEASKNKKLKKIREKFATSVAKEYAKEYLLPSIIIGIFVLIVIIIVHPLYQFNELVYAGIYVLLFLLYEIIFKKRYFESSPLIS